ncbi:MAG: cupin-like domain-containing protein [Novosphingobium sp.]
MNAQVFPAATLAALGDAYPLMPTKLGHSLLSHPLLSLAALEALACALPADSVEFNPGKLPIGIAPDDVPVASLGVAETIRTIERSSSWVALKRIEQLPAYADLLDTILAELEPIVKPVSGEMLLHEGFIFISSPGSVTPFHFDPEHNVLLQVQGSKTMTIFPASDEELISPTVHEAFHVGKHHRNLAWREEFAARGEAITIGPGQAIHVPPKSPHWVANGPDVSVSLSVTWRSRWSFAEADARAFNALLRQAGLNPRRPSSFPGRNLGKSLAYRVIRRMGGLPKQGGQSGPGA